MASLIVDLAMWHRAFTFVRGNMIQVNSGHTNSICRLEELATRFASMKVNMEPQNVDFLKHLLFLGVHIHVPFSLSWPSCSIYDLSWPHREWYKKHVIILGFSNQNTPTLTRIYLRIYMAYLFIYAYCIPTTCLFSILTLGNLIFQPNQVSQKII